MVIPVGDVVWVVGVDVVVIEVVVDVVVVVEVVVVVVVSSLSKQQVQVNKAASVIKMKNFFIWE